MNKKSGIHSVNADPTGRNKADALAPEIRRIHDTVQAGLSDLLVGAFDAIDDSLFEMANNARNNNDQNRYFETMREIRIKRKGVERRFLESLINLFTDPPASDARNKQAGIEQASADNLSLVQNDELEEEVAVNAMVTKAQAHFQGTLLQLQTRLSAVYHGPENDRPVNPLAPEHLCGIFQKACNELDIQIRERLIVLKHFDRYVIANLGMLLEEANRILIQAGVMPNFRYAARVSENSHSRRTRGKASRTSPDNDAEPGSETEFFEKIRDLLANYRELSHGASASGSASIHVVSGKELYDMLANLPQSVEDSDLNRSQAKVLDLRAMVSELLKQQEADDGSQAGLQEVDEDLINLVSLLFEFILEDNNLSPPIQVLISRLQIPILKVVIKDRSFFSKPAHPARKLLNSLARAGIGWSDGREKERDRLYKEIYRVVHRILDEFDGDIRLFETLYNEFEQFLTRENRKAALVEQRTRESERGRIKSRKAQETVDAILQEKLRGQQVPDCIHEILLHGWSRVMFLAYLRDENEHRWAHSVQVVDDLLWCLRPQHDHQGREQWVRLVPPLIKSLRAGLEEVSCNSKRLDDMMAQLKRELTTAFREHAQAAGADDPKPVEDAKPEPEQITAVQHQQRLEEAALAEHLSVIKGINIGDWVEFSLSNGSCFRAKLSAIIEDADCFVFVNRMGLKVVEKTRNELAHELRQGRLSLLEQGALIDRALDAVIGGLARKAG